MKQGKINAAYETIDRHVEEGFGNKIAIHYINGTERKSYTFKEIKDKTDHYARILKRKGSQKRGSCFCIFTKNSRMLYSNLSGYQSRSNRRAAF